MQSYVKLLWDRALRINERRIPELVDPPAIKRDFDDVLSLPLNRQSCEIKTMQKALAFLLWKLMVRGLGHTHIHVLNS
jgi:hypothetical protein